MEWGPEGRSDRRGRDERTSGWDCVLGPCPWGHPPEGLCLWLWAGREAGEKDNGRLVAGAKVGAVSLEKEEKQGSKDTETLVIWMLVFGKQSPAQGTSKLLACKLPSLCTLSLPRPTRGVLGAYSPAAWVIAAVSGRPWDSVPHLPVPSPSHQLQTRKDLLVGAACGIQEKPGPEVGVCWIKEGLRMCGCREVRDRSRWAFRAWSLDTDRALGPTLKPWHSQVLCRLRHSDTATQMSLDKD